MRVVLLAQAEYGKGRLLLFCSRFDNALTGNAGVPDSFTSRLLEWVSGRAPEEPIHVLSVPVSGPVALLPTDAHDQISVVNEHPNFLSESSELAAFHAVVISGVANSLSPLVRANIREYVSDGGGLVVVAPAVSADYIELLSTMVPVYVQDAWTVATEEVTQWTAYGQAHYVFLEEFGHLDIAPTAVVQEDDLDPAWAIMIVSDAEGTEPAPEDTTSESDDIYYSPSDGVALGLHFVGYYGTNYQRGIIEVEGS